MMPAWRMDHVAARTLPRILADAVGALLREVRSELTDP